MVHASVTLDEDLDDYLDDLEDERDDIDSRSDAVRTYITEHRDGVASSEELDELEDVLHERELMIARLEVANEHLTARVNELREKNSDIEMITSTIQRLDSIPVGSPTELPEGEDDGQGPEPDAETDSSSRSGPLTAIRGWFSR